MNSVFQKRRRHNAVQPMAGYTLVLCPLSSVAYSAVRRLVITQRVHAHVYVMQHLPTAVGGAHNSPVANATVILKSGLVNYRLHQYNLTRVGPFTSPGIDTG